MTYSSHRSAAVVSDCIAEGWRKIPSSGVELPVAVTQQAGLYFVEVVLVRDFPTFLPIRSMWAKVTPSPGAETGSTTEYRRNLQMSHGKIDGVVVTCQEATVDAPAPDDPLQADDAGVSPP